MRSFIVFLSLAAVFLVAGCSDPRSWRIPSVGSLKPSNELEKLNSVQAVGAPFTRYLFEEYRDYANFRHEHRDYADALHFARKGIAAAYGETVMPEVLDDWDLNRGHLQEMVPARAQLVDVLENGGRDVAARLAARAQARFDCWVEQQEEDWHGEIPHCRREFYAALRELQTLVVPEPYVEPEPPVTVQQPVREPVPLDQAMFIVFFDWDKSVLTQSALDVLDAIADEVKSREDVTRIKIVGHTDSSGSRAYNQRLSMRRGNAVRDALAERGVDPSKLVVEGRGQEDLLVKTADNVREPANRRAQISLE
ncbi:MAG: OmpA family protein [Micavibrio sp.]|nr:MAG: OmpA family protein [Micavibrio sp.]